MGFGKDAYAFGARLRILQEGLHGASQPSAQTTITSTKTLNIKISFKNEYPDHMTTTPEDHGTRGTQQTRGPKQQGPGFRV